MKTLSIDFPQYFNLGEAIPVTVADGPHGASRYVVTVDPELDPFPPWEWDGFIPTIIHHDCNSSVRGSTKFDLTDPLPMVDKRKLDDPATVSRVVAAVGATDQAYREFLEELEYGEGDSETLHEFVRDRLDEATPSAYSTGSTGDYFETLLAVYQALDIPAESFAITGSHPSDYAECLAVWAPDWRKTAGLENAPMDDPTAKIDARRDFATHKEQLRQYWEGEVYGCTIESPHGDMLDSCYGLYGRDSILDFVQELIGWEVDQANERDEFARLMASVSIGFAAI